ncbi:LuxR family transcriptional regulator [Streptomyces sp. NBC_01477]|uniref:LuxR family transcriptional regulator n=1 Tax=Streptomyces sp. NBC_01477 TaxID=2976015 RepID=UPI002E359889|nr:LuxR family transcriptional regulator [Streptomyces sp. NBC_01477]
MSAGSTPTPETLPPPNLPLQSLLRIADTLSSLERYAIETAGQLVLAEGAGAGTAEAPGRIRHLDGQAAVQDAINEALWRAKHEILTAQPDGPGPGATLHEALAAVRDPLTRGVAMRTLFQHSARFSEPAKKYVQQVLAYGGQVRTLPEFFDRLIIVDAEVAFIPGGEHRHSAALIQDRAVVAFLSDVFERAWVRAERFPFRPVRAADAAGEVVPDMRQAIKALLVEGRSDKAIARRLGMSLRSVQGHIASLREQYGAQHRFQLGYRMARSEYAAARPAPAEPLPDHAPGTDVYALGRVTSGPSADTRANGSSASGRPRP